MAPSLGGVGLLIVELGAALVLGLVGSGHCLVMCGPLALAVRYPGQGFGLHWSRVRYNLGRTVTYATLGLLFGALGQGLAIAGLQRALSVLLGVGLLVLALTRGLSGANPPQVLTRWLVALQRALYRILRRGKRAEDGDSDRTELPAFSSPFALGLLNGLLPCGLVWAGLAAAAALGSATRGGLFMATFGLGTMPALLALATFGHHAPPGLRTRLARATPVVLVLLAALLVARGLFVAGPHAGAHTMTMPHAP